MQISPVKRPAFLPAKIVGYRLGVLYELDLIKIGRISFLKFIVSYRNDVDNFFDVFKFKKRLLF